MLVGNHDSLMNTISDRLLRHSQYQVSSVLANPGTAIVAIRRHPVDIVLIDVDSTSPRWPWDQSLLRELMDVASVILLSAIIEDHTLSWALDSGISGLLLKSELSEEIIPAIQEVLTGGSWFPKDAHERIVVDANGTRLAEPDLYPGVSCDPPKRLQLE